MKHYNLNTVVFSIPFCPIGQRIVYHPGSCLETASEVAVGAGRPRAQSWADCVTINLLW